MKEILLGMCLMAAMPSFGQRYAKAPVVGVGNYVFSQATEKSDPDLPSTQWENHADVSWYNVGIQSFDLSTAEQLAGLALLVSQGNNFSGVTIHLSSDVDLSMHMWLPIGFNNDKPFSGVFDGGNFTVKNLKVQARRDFLGLFGQVVSGEIKNVNVEGAFVKGRDNVGALSGNFVNSKVKNCHVKNVYVEAIVDPRESLYGYTAGAFCGGAISETVIEQCSAKGQVKGGLQIGGFIGSPWDKTIIKQSYFEGEVEGVDIVGGFVGFSTFAFGANREVVIEDCYTKAQVTGEGNVGGFYGVNQMGKVANVYAVSQVQGTQALGAFAGGATGGAVFVNVHYDRTLVGHLPGIGGEYGGTDYTQAHSSEDMKNEAFANLLNADRGISVWKHEPAYNQGYPLLVGHDYLGVSNSTSVSSELKIYPTLVKNTIYIKTPIPVLYYKIIDYSGRVIKQASYNGEDIEVSELKSGNYLLELSGRDWRLVKRFIKK